MLLKCCTCISHRYLVVILCFIIMLVSIGYRTCFAMMTTHISFFNTTSSQSEDSSIFPNCTTTGTNRSKIVHWSGSTVSSFNTAYFVGQTVMSFPAGILVMKWSPKLMFGLTILSSSILQTLLPVATDVPVELLFTIRTIQGMLEAAAVPAMNAVISCWAPKHEKARLINFAYSGVYLSPAVAWIATGATSCYVSWDSIMYIYGSLGAVVCIVWILVIASSPGTHPKLPEEEQRLLGQDGISTTTKANSNEKVPWLKILTSLPMISIWIAAFCRNFIFGILLTEIQQYYKDVYNLPASMNGLLCGVPQLFMALFMVVGACFFDMLIKREKLSVTNTRKLAQCSGFGVLGGCTLAIGFVDNYIVVFVLMCVGVGFSGFAISGYTTNPLDLAPQFVGPLTGISRTGMLGSVISVLLVSVLTGETHRLIDWQRLFIIAGSIILAGAVFYAIFASGNLQSWAQPNTSVVYANVPVTSTYGSPDQQSSINYAKTDTGSKDEKAIYDSLDYSNARPYDELVY